MKGLELDRATGLYQAKAALQLHYHPIDHEAFWRFCQARVLFLRSLGQSEGDAFWDDFAGVVGRFRFRAASTPLSFRAITHGVAGVDLVRLRQFLLRAKSVYPALARVANDVLDAFEQICDSEDNPLFHMVLSLAAQKATDTAVVVRDDRLIDAVRSQLGSDPRTITFQILTPRELRTDRGYDQLIVVGSASWFGDFVFSAPRAPVIHVIGFRWDVREWRRVRLLPGRDDAGNPQGARVLAQTGGFTEDEPWPQIDWQRTLGSPSFGRHIDSTAGVLDEIDAWLLSLDGDLAVLLDASDGATCLAIEPDELGAARVARTPPADLVPGVFVLLRTDGDGDYISPVADRIMGIRAQTLRERIREWKQGLRFHATNDGVGYVARQLSRLGAIRAEEINVRNWMSDRNIGPQGEADLNAVMALLGRSTDASDVWKITRQVRAAHLRAGMAVRKRLLENVTRVDATEFLAKGRLDFILPEAEGGRLSAFRVEGRTSTTSRVTSSRLNVPFSYEPI